ncbi:hypothetical protein HMPREF0208_04874 [Citrobacter koseri]|nr:hypothetical protein HMPREF3220_04265 [Citrobacter koseri]KXA02583.1 hypothetical protein HMPREF3207_02445 [Citrobacter koseri]KXB39470.1 hypothetical protein HMPREF0208_04874 [Citrobacter koseri]
MKHFCVAYSEKMYALQKGEFIVDSASQQRIIPNVVGILTR